MLFNSLTYLTFLPLVAILYWLVPTRFGHIILLVASYVFYMSWMKGYGFLLFGLTVANYALAILLHRTNTHVRRRIVFIAGLALNLGCLALFKYTNFIIESLRQSSQFFASLLGDSRLWFSDWSTLPIVLPLGISFFVFEFIHYLVDVFKGTKPVTSPIRFGLFAAFFPSQIAGPIKRFQDFEQQLLNERRFDAGLCRSGVLLLLQGLFKKVVLGDNLAPIVQQGSQPAVLGTADAWLCVGAFALQIYYDFSGYTDMGRGSAMILGFQLPENFNMPYLATSIKDFWHRWHISLSTWLRDYLFIPLGGSRGKPSTAIINLMITMLLGGLWHGAAWHYVVWGAYQGIGLALNRIFDDFIAKHKTLQDATRSWWWHSLAVVGTFIIVCCGWVLFRANTLAETGDMYQAMFSLRWSATAEATISELFWSSSLPTGLALYVVAFFGATLYSTRAHSLKLKPLRFPAYAQAIGLAGFVLVVLGLAPLKSIPFIYFQF
jgi:alginate O-acetyltransferase complex protein AlgI